MELSEVVPVGSGALRTQGSPFGPLDSCAGLTCTAAIRVFTPPAFLNQDGLCPDAGFNQICARLVLSNATPQSVLRNVYLKIVSLIATPPESAPGADIFGLNGDRVRSAHTASVGTSNWGIWYFGHVKAASGAPDGNGIRTNDAVIPFALRHPSPFASAPSYRFHMQVFGELVTATGSAPINASCAAPAASETPVLAAADTDCDGINGTIANSVFVTNTPGIAFGTVCTGTPWQRRDCDDGSLRRPYGTLLAASQNLAGRTAIYIARGADYTGATARLELNLGNGPFIGVFGGYQISDGFVSRVVSGGNRTRIVGGNDQTVPGFLGGFSIRNVNNGGAFPVRVQRIRFQSAAATASRPNTFAALVSGVSGAGAGGDLIFQDSVIDMQEGAKGTDGVSNGPPTTPAGLPANAGTGAPGGGRACFVGTAGAGGNFGTGVANAAGNPGVAGAAGSPGGTGGAPGAGGAQNPVCASAAPGENGLQGTFPANGVAGSPMLAGTENGTFDGTTGEYTPPPIVGSGGTPGENGGGGGGGGAGGGCLNGGSPLAGNRGGGGGGGGCGAPGGTNGAAGGAAVGVFALGSNVLFQSGSFVVLARGGNGGNGGNARTPGPGGQGASGLNLAPSGPGGTGANGRPGGNGGSGAGGAGGPAICAIHNASGSFGGMGNPSATAVCPDTFPGTATAGPNGTVGVPPTGSSPPGTYTEVRLIP